MAEGAAASHSAKPSPVWLCQIITSASARVTLVPPLCRTAASTSGATGSGPTFTGVGWAGVTDMYLTIRTVRFHFATAACQYCIENVKGVLTTAPSAGRPVFRSLRTSRPEQ